MQFAIDASRLPGRFASDRAAAKLVGVGRLLQAIVELAYFDCIVSIATLRHLPPGEMLGKMKRSRTVNSILPVLDLFRGKGLSDYRAAW